jgi:hypothetical protein
MAFADPQSVVVGANTISLPRTSSGVNSGAFSDGDRTVALSVSHAYGKRTRRTIRLDHAKIAPDQFTAVNMRHTMSAYIVVDTPVSGYTIAEAKEVVDYLVKYLSASTGASVTKLLGGES